MNAVAQLQEDVAGRIESSDVFADVPVIVLRRGEAESQALEALGVRNEQNGKGGACVLVAMPSRMVPSPDIPGPQYDLELIVRVLENRSLNRGPGGHNLTAEDMAEAVDQILHLFCNDTTALYATRQHPIEAGDDGAVGFDCFYKFSTGLRPPVKTTKPKIVGNHAGSAYSVTCATPGAVIRYTINDPGASAYPGADAEIWPADAPFPLIDHFQTLRCVAYADNRLASDLSEQFFS